MTTYKELEATRGLEQQISEARRRELSDAISQVRSLVAEFGLTSQDVFPLAVPAAPALAPGGAWASTATPRQAKPGRAVARRPSGFKTKTASSSRFEGFHALLKSPLLRAFYGRWYFVRNAKDIEPLETGFSFRHLYGPALMDSTFGSSHPPERSDCLRHLDNHFSNWGACCSFLTSLCGCMGYLTRLAVSEAVALKTTNSAAI